MSSRTTYEIRLNDADRWFVEKVFPTEQKAQELCQEFVEDENSEYVGVQVVRVWKRADGLEVEKVLREERLTQRNRPISLVPIDEAAPCAHRDDYLGLNARLTMSRMLRFYLEREGLIPSELIYSYERTKRFMAGDLVTSAIDRIATLQARDSGIDSRKRRDAIFVEVQNIMDDVHVLAKKKSVKNFESDKLEDIVKKSKSFGKPMAFHVLLCKSLVANRSLEGKLEKVLNWLETDLGKDYEDELDSIVAEIMSSASLIQDMLGPQRNMATAISTLLDWVDGLEVEATGAAPHCVEKICQLFSEDRLEATRDVLFDFILRQLGGRQPLSRNNPSREEEEFMLLFARLAFPSGMTGGSDMAEALSRRYARSMKQGGESGDRLSIKWLLDLLPNGASKLPYLLALKDAPLGEAHPDIISQSVYQISQTASSILDFSDSDMSPRDRLQCLKDLHVLVEESSLDEGDQRRLLTTMDRMVEKYLVDTRLIDKLDNPDATLKDRAVRMVQFCGSGVLWEHGHAMALARQRVVDHLKGAGFVEKFTAEEDDPVKKESMVRDFYKLLADAGFKI